MDGFLVLINRSLDAEPVGLYGDEAAAFARATEIVAGFDATREAAGRPPRGRGEIGPPGVVSLFQCVDVIPFREGLPVPAERSRFIQRRPLLKPRGSRGAREDEPSLGGIPNHVMAGGVDPPTRRRKPK